MGLTPLQYTRQTETRYFRNHFRKYRYLSFSYTYLGFNLQNPMFADRRVRQALAHAIDKEAIISGVLLGLGKPATGPLKPGTWAYNPNLRTYPHDPAKARSLLAEAGWKDTDGDGILDKDGKPFTPSDAKKFQMILYAAEASKEHLFTAHEGGMTRDQLLAVLEEMGVRVD
jgi:peptide/nickel transport system substrate-binding protein